jgi:ferrous iron transport protein B
MRFALIGQPNCGKSTIFNQVAGYKAETGNFSGTTVTYTESKVRVLGEVVELIDLPGTYTLIGSNPAERETIRYLSSHQVDVIINVIDASHLSQGLVLTLELLELQHPTLVALNMMDEAARLGMTIDGPKLIDILGTFVVPLIASRGRGVRNLFTTALEIGRRGDIPTRINYGKGIEEALHKIADQINGRTSRIHAERIAIKLLEGEGDQGQFIQYETPAVSLILEEFRSKIFEEYGQEAIWVLSAERHTIAASIAHQVVQYGDRRISWRDRFDNVLLHPFWGYVFLDLILLIFFELIFLLGSSLERPLLAFFNWLNSQVVIALDSFPFIAEVVSGTLQGFAGGVAIVLPYLIPFLLGLGFLEDVGYLPRVAFLMDALMHRIGLHGKAIVPFILGYGCNVPAVMSTRMLEDRRDRYLAAALATLVPCAARLAVVFGLVAFYLGPGLALGIYLFNLFVIALTGWIISGLLPEDTPGLILEIPVYRLPTLKTVVQKAWFRVREFTIEAWPILIAGSIFLSILNYLNIAVMVNFIVLPVTWLLGLPGEVGVPLIFGILRKELSLIMLRQALNVSDFSQALTEIQMITFTVFVVFYVPCLATLAILKRELGRRDMLSIAGITVIIAVIAASFARLIATIVYGLLRS